MNWGRLASKSLGLTLLVGWITLCGCMTVTTRSVVIPATNDDTPVAMREKTRQTTIEINLTLPELASTETTASSVDQPQVALPDQYSPRHVQQAQKRVLEAEVVASQEETITSEPTEAPELYLAARPSHESESSSSEQIVEPAPLVLASTTAVPVAEPLEFAASDLPPVSATEDFAIVLADVSLANLERLTFSNHPSLAQASAQIRAQRGRWVQAGLSTNPEVGFSGQQLGSGGEAEQIGVFVGKTIIRGGKQCLDQAVLARKIRVAEQQVEHMRLSVKNQLHQAYYHLGIAYRRQEVSAELASVLTENLRLTQVLYDSKEVGKVDVLREKMQLEVVTTELEKAKRDVQGAIERLRAVVGDNVLELNEEQLEIIASSLPSAKDLSVEVSPDDWPTIHPDLAIATFNIEAARWQVERERAERFSDLDLQMVMQYDESTKSGNGNLQISGPLQLWNKNQGAVQAAYAELTAAQRQYEATERKLNQEFAVAFAQFQQSKEYVARYTRPEGVLQMARESVELLEKGVEVGEFNRLALFLAQKERMQHELDFIEALGKSLDQKANLESLLIE